MAKPRVLFFYKDLWPESALFSNFLPGNGNFYFFFIFKIFLSFCGATRMFGWFSNLTHTYGYVRNSERLPLCNSPCPAWARPPRLRSPRALLHRWTEVIHRTTPPCYFRNRLSTESSDDSRIEIRNPLIKILRLLFPPVNGIFWKNESRFLLKEKKKTTG